MKLREKKSPNNLVTIQESVIIESGSKKILLEKGNKIKILTEQLTWDDVVEIINSENLSKETVGLVNFIDKNRNKYIDQINDFVDWFGDISDDIDNMDRIIKKNDPSETFDKVPSENWSYYKAYA
jgi:hypothetical protein